MDVHETLQQIFRDIFDDSLLNITRDTTANDIEDWDSLAQINIIVACESAFNVKFDINDITNLENVGGMIDLIERKM